MAEKEAQTQLATRVNAGLMKRLKLAAVQDETTIAEIVGSAVTVELEKRTAKRKAAKGK